MSMQTTQSTNGGAVKPYDVVLEKPSPATTVGKKLLTAAAVYVAYSIPHISHVFGSRTASTKPCFAVISSEWSCCFWSLS